MHESVDDSDDHDGGTRRAGCLRAGADSVERDHSRTRRGRHGDDADDDSADARRPRARYNNGGCKRERWRVGVHCAVAKYRHLGLLGSARRERRVARCRLHADHEHVGEHGGEPCAGEHRASVHWNSRNTLDEDASRVASAVRGQRGL